MLKRARVDHKVLRAVYFWRLKYFPVFVVAAFFMQNR